jgi:hypothetical protein
MGLSLQSFALLGDPKKVSLLSLRSCAFTPNLSGLAPALQRLAPTEKPSPSSYPEA